MEAQAQEEVWKQMWLEISVVTEVCEDTNVVCYITCTKGCNKQGRTFPK